MSERTNETWLNSLKSKGAARELALQDLRAFIFRGVMGYLHSRSDLSRLDIKDLDDAMARTTHDDIRQVYEHLRMGSEHHMRAFVSNLRAQGADYQPQYISMEEFQKILSSTPGHGQGHGPGAGEGCGGERGGEHGQGGPPWMATPSPTP